VTGGFGPPNNAFKQGTVPYEEGITNVPPQTMGSIPAPSKKPMMQPLGQEKPLNEKDLQNLCNNHEELISKPPHL
jgi:hypothetical protein